MLERGAPLAAMIRGLIYQEAGGTTTKPSCGDQQLLPRARCPLQILEVDYKPKIRALPQPRRLKMKSLRQDVLAMLECIR